MTTPETPTPSTPADHKRSERWHQARVIGGALVICAAALFAIWFFQDPITYYGQRTVQTIKSGRPTVERIAVVPAATPETVKATQLSTTDDNRVVIVETTQVKTDLVDTIAGLKKQAADAKEAAEKAIAEAKSSAEKLAAAAQESTVLKTAVSSLQSAIEKSTAQGREYLDIYKKSQNSAPPKPQASNNVRQQLASDDDRQSTVGGGKVHFDRSGIPANWEIRGGDFSKAEKCNGTVYVARKERLPDGGVRNFLGCRPN